MDRRLAVVVLLAAAAVVWGLARQQTPAPVAVEPTVNPADFTTSIDNPYFSLPVGKKMVYEGETEEGRERVEILIPGWTRTVVGVETLVYWDRVYRDGMLIEDTRDYVAQHKETGAVWYFGEHVDNYEDGRLVDHEGAWLAGVDGAQPGVWFPGQPRAGEDYRQEYLVGKAEDAVRVESLAETVTVPAGTFTDCVKVFEHSPLSTATAHKFYCQPVGGAALEVDLPDLPDMPRERRLELIAVDERGALGQPLPEGYRQEGVTGVDE